MNGGGYATAYDQPRTSNRIYTSVLTSVTTTQMGLMNGPEANEDST